MSALRLTLSLLAFASLAPFSQSALAQSASPTMHTLKAAPVGPATAPLAAEPKTRLGTGWGIGATAGTTSAIGLSMRRHFDNRFGVHLGGIYIYTGDVHWGSFGAQALYTLARGRKTRLYGLLGSQILLRHDKQDPQGPGSRTSTTLFAGPGLGVEIHFTKHFGWSIEVPASVAFALDGKKDRLPFGGVVNLIPAANTAFTFYFR